VSTVGKLIPARRASCFALTAALTVFPASVQAGELIWLAPLRAPAGTLLVGLTQIDAKGGAHLPKGATASASPGELEQLPDQGPVRVFSVQATPGELRLSASTAGGLQANTLVAVGSSSASVRVVATPAAPVKHKDESAELEITVLRGDGSPDREAPPPVIRSNVGEVRGVTARGDGTFAARYFLPRERHPEVAIVVAFAPWPHADSTEGAFGAAAIPLASAVALPGSTEPAAQVSVEIAGKAFGPVTAGPEGRFELPIVAPPGHRYGTSITTDRAGNRRSKKIDLRLPPTDQIACVANPAMLPADGKSRARVLCMATDPFGKPVDRALITSEVRFGRLQGPVPRSGGVYEWEYLAPTRLPPEPEQILFRYPAGGSQSREQMILRLTPTAASKAELMVEPPLVFQGATGTVTLKTWDRSGRPVAVRAKLATGQGSLGELIPIEPGVITARYTPPQSPNAWADTINASVLALAGSTPSYIRLQAAAGALSARAEDLAGGPIEGLALELEGVKAVTSGEGIAVFRIPMPKTSEPVQHLCVRAVNRPSLQADLWRLVGPEAEQFFPASEVRGALDLRIPVSLAPSTPLDIRMELIAEAGKSRLLYRVLDVQGRFMRGRRVSCHVTGADGTEVRMGEPAELPDGSISIPLLGATRGSVFVSVTDVASGVSAAQEFTLP
jgi:hypothetical protein